MSPRTLITRPSLPAGIPSTSLTNTTVSPTSISFDSSLLVFTFSNGAATLYSRGNSVGYTVEVFVTILRLGEVKGRALHWRWDVRLIARFK
jgi:hypothetical protein